MMHPARDFGALPDIVNAAAEGQAPCLQQTLGNEPGVLVILGPLAQFVGPDVLVRFKFKVCDNALEFADSGLDWCDYL